MKFDSKVKGGLAWAGLFVILAVPSADLLFGKGDAAPATNLAVTSDTAQVKAPVAVPAVKPVLGADPVETASITTPATKGDDPVETYIDSGKKLPAYISDADTAPAAKPATPAVPATIKAPVEVAAVNPAAEIAPVPLPRDARPKAKAPVVATVPATPAANQPLIIDETELNQREAALTPAQPMEPFPLSDGANDVVVTGDQLDEWDSGSLADYLEQRGMLSEDARPDDSVVVYNNGPSRERRPLRDFFLF